MIEISEKLNGDLKIVFMNDDIQPFEFKGANMFEIEADPLYPGKFRLLYNGAVVESNLTKDQAVQKSNEPDEADEYFKDPLEYEARCAGIAELSFEHSDSYDDDLFSIKLEEDKEENDPNDL